jgi:hypothetical protein
MKTMTRWTNVGGATLGLGLSLLMVGTGTAQVRVGEAVACPAGMEVGDIGISGLDCVGECTLSIKEDGSSRSWFFSAEPRVFGVESGGPTDGILESGDLLVAIDGLLITTKEGGQRYANLEPGERIRLRYRRDGRAREASVRVEEGCLDPPNPAGMISRVPPPPTPPDEVRSVGIAVAPRVRVAPTRRPTPTTGTSSSRGVSRTTVPRRAPVGILETTSPAGSLGIGISCTNCGTRTDEETGEDIWFFSGPLEVTAVNTGGPASGAGIQRGDLIKAIDGNALDTDAGGLAFTRLRAGERVGLTVVKRTGAEVQVGLVPEERTRARRPTRVSEPAPASEPASPRSTGVATAPAGMPLRYSGTMSGVEVEVRGDPVMVSEMEGARTIYINADGLWIRITVPRRTLVPEPESRGSGTILRR